MAGSDDPAGLLGQLAEASAEFFALGWWLWLMPYHAGHA
jgi:hypothetical protein